MNGSIVLVLFAAAFASAPAAAQAGGDPVCAQRGRDSLKVVWAREGGATQERLLAEARTEQEKVAVREAFRRPGSATSVQQAVEADCNVEKEKQARAAPVAPAAPAAAPPADATEKPAGDATLRAEYEARNAEMKRRNCVRMGKERESLDNRARRGGNVAAMERFADERRQLERRIRDEGC